MKLKNLDNYTKYAYIAIIIGILIRFLLVSISHPSGDACWHLSTSRFIAENGRIPLFENIGRDVFWVFPFFHVLASIVYNLFSIFGPETAEISMRYISPFFGSLSLFLVFSLSKLLFNKKIAFYVTFFMAFFPISIFYSVLSYLGSTAAFFSLLSIYLILKNRWIFSAISVSIAILTKYMAAFIVPVLIYLIFKKNKKFFIKNAASILSLIIILVSPWMVRNYIHLGNPIWPFFNSIFNGYVAQEAITGFSILNLFDINHLIKFYLGLFGVPNGSLSAFSFISIPGIEFFIGMWVLATLVFFSIFILGLIKMKYDNWKAKMMIIWILSFIFGLMLYIINVNNIFARFFLSALFPMAVIWSLGLDYILSHYKKYAKIIVIIILLVTIGFISTEFFKISFSAKSWNKYSDDFEWVKTNTPENSIIMVSGQCISYNLNRISAFASEDLNNIDYIWFNQDFYLEPSSKLSDRIVKKIDDRDLKIIYENPKTKTKIYQIK